MGRPARNSLFDLKNQWGRKHETEIETILFIPSFVPIVRQEVNRAQAPMEGLYASERREKDEAIGHTGKPTTKNQ